jgi:hypothetical protein
MKEASNLWINNDKIQRKQRLEKKKRIKEKKGEEGGATTRKPKMQPYKRNKGKVHDE